MSDLALYRVSPDQRGSAGTEPVDDASSLEVCSRSLLAVVLADPTDETVNGHQNDIEDANSVGRRPGFCRGYGCTAHSGGGGGGLLYHVLPGAFVILIGVTRDRNGRLTGRILLHPVATDG